MTHHRWAVVAALVLLLGGCGDPGDALEESATCPGSSCTEDTRARVDAIAELAGVSDVVEVAREYGLDRGSHRTAEVRTAFTSDREVRDVGLAVMRALEEWPDHADGGATVVVSPAEGEPVTFLLDGDWVCEQPPGKRIACTADNSWTLDGDAISR